MANNAESGLKHQEAIKPKSGLSSHENGRNLYLNVLVNLQGSVSTYMYFTSNHL